MVVTSGFIIRVITTAVRMALFYQPLAFIKHKCSWHQTCTCLGWDIHYKGFFYALLFPSSKEQIYI
ncbi:hypothetical protein Hdeb2414_s0001g00033011 [Helianthus debilis subsp. tardiflorus]